MDHHSVETTTPSGASVLQTVPPKATPDGAPQAKVAKLAAGEQASASASVPGMSEADTRLRRALLARMQK